MGTKLMFENEVVKGVANFLIGMEGAPESVQMCLGKKKGPDLMIEIHGHRIIIEGKGARANPEDGEIKRERFDGGQLVKHYGDLLIQAIRRRSQYPDALVGVALPDHPHVRARLAGLIDGFRELGIPHFWVIDGNVDLSKEDTEILWSAIYDKSA